MNLDAIIAAAAAAKYFLMNGFAFYRLPQIVLAISFVSPSKFDYNFLFILS